MAQKGQNLQMNAPQMDNRVGGGMHSHGPSAVQGNGEFGFVVDPLTLQSVLQDTVEQAAGAQAEGSNRSGARRLSMPVPYK